jgi:hypothetical protein
MLSIHIRRIIISKNVYFSKKHLNIYKLLYYYNNNMIDVFPKLINFNIIKVFRHYYCYLFQ